MPIPSQSSSRIRIQTVVLICLLYVARGFAVTNVNCVGDSITFGSGISNGETYPAKLQRLLGTNYSVANYGVSGATLLKAGDNPYWNQNAYTLSHGTRGGQVPHIVIIMLGSNDAKPQNWQYGTNFIPDYAEFVATYTNLASQPRVLICTPPPVFGSGAFNINPGVVETNIAPIVRQLSSTLGRELIDMNLLFAGHYEWFPDTVHPDSRGSTVMAAIVYTALRGDTMNGNIPTLGLARPVTNKAVLNWSAAGAGWVLQSTAGLGGSNSWLVENRLAANDGVSIRFTNNLPASGAAMFRLWRPYY